MNELNEFMDTRHPEVLKTIREKKDLTDEVKTALDRALSEFADVFRPTKAGEKAA
jgi:F-type H+-transporting ATPase subunit alpha